MRILKGILFCLFIFTASYGGAVNTMSYPAFGSTSAYMGNRTGYTSSATSYTMHHTLYTNRPTGSMTAISASNFAALNDEGGAFYQPSATTHRPGVRREGRDDEDDDDGNNAIGEYDFHSPVGNTPWVLILLLLFAYVIKKQYLCRRIGNE